MIKNNKNRVIGTFNAPLTGQYYRQNYYSGTFWSLAQMASMNRAQPVTGELRQISHCE